MSRTETNRMTETVALDDVMAAAQAASRSLAAAEGDDRARWLRAVADALDAAEEELVPLADDESSLGVTRLRGELGRTTGQLRLFAEVVLEGSYLEIAIDHADPGATLPSPHLRRMLRPLGPIAVFAAGNFPFAFSVAGGDTASALAAGCPVVVKAHPGHPRLSRRTAEILGGALRGADAPVGTFALVEGLETGRALVAHPDVKAVAFTGSLDGGRVLFDLAASRPDPIPFYGELSSINPVVITPEAAAERPEELANGLIGSVTLGVGQFCTKPGLVLVPHDRRLEDAIVVAAGDLPAGVMLSERMADGFRSGLARLIETGRVEVLAGDAGQALAGRHVSAVVLATSVEDMSSAADVLTAECFGPVTLLVRYEPRELDEALAAMPGSLTATIHARDAEDAAVPSALDRFVEFAGRVIFNGWPTGVAVTWAQHHGGPWPSTTDPLHTSVGPAAIRRFLRPVTYQSVPDDLLPPALQESNPLRLPRCVDGVKVGVGPAATS